jgi:transposase-like protein
MKPLENLRNVFKTVKHQKSTAHMFCPRCGSPRLSLSSSLEYWLLPQQYTCKDCGYFGALYMTLEKEEENKEKEENSSA